VDSFASVTLVTGYFYFVTWITRVGPRRKNLHISIFANIHHSLNYLHLSAISFRILNKTSTYYIQKNDLEGACSIPGRSASISCGQIGTKTEICPSTAFPSDGPSYRAV